MKKVWYIDEPELDAFPGLTQSAPLMPGQVCLAATALGKTQQKNPAVAFSLSLLAWGAGQFYLGARRSALILLATMVLYYSVVLILTLVWGLLKDYLVELPCFIWLLPGLFLVGVMFWVGNAIDAYYRTRSARNKPFLGVERKLWPFCASLLLPGWGQFLNGQPKKGCLFLLLSMAGIWSALVLLTARTVWPLLLNAEDRQCYELCLLIGLSLILFGFLTWIVASYDAFRSCEEYVRYKQRSQSAGYRLHERGILIEFMPQCSAVLGLMLAISLAMQGFPKQYYIDQLQWLREVMQQAQMTIIPELVGKLLAVLSW